MVAPTNCGPTLPSQPRAASPPGRCGQQGPRQRRWRMADKPNVVLVHGGFVDGSGWQGVYDLLTADGYRVDVVQNPTLSLQGDAAATRMVLDRQDGHRRRGRREPLGVRLPTCCRRRPDQAGGNRR